MEYRHLGRTGLKVSELCLGTMQFGWTCDEAMAYKILSAAYESGLNFIDTADVYSKWAAGNPGGVAETIIGNWLKNNGGSRHQVVIATKVRGSMGSGPNDEGLSRAHIMQAVEASLRRLGTDYIDLYQTHWYDEGTPIEETLKVMDDLVRQGKVRYIGCSNYPAWRMMQSLWTSDRLNLARYDSLQPHYHLLNRAEFEVELMEICLTYGIGVIPYSPLAGGFLTGKYRREILADSTRREDLRHLFTEKNFALLDQMDAIGKDKGGYSTSQVALAWLLTNPAITSPIIGPRSLDQLKDNLGAAGLRLTADEMDHLNKATHWREDES